MAHIALPEELKTTLGHTDGLLTSVTALVNEVRETNRLLQQLLLQQIAARPVEPPRRPRVHHGATR